MSDDGSKWHFLFMVMETTSLCHSLSRAQVGPHSIPIDQKLCKAVDAEMELMAKRKKHEEENKEEQKSQMCG